MSYITNIDTLSALLDRLISENIKLHFFRKEGVVDNIESITTAYAVNLNRDEGISSDTQQIAGYYS